MKEEKIFTELGATPTDKLYRVCRSFWLSLVVGPLVQIRIGGVVQLTKETAEALFFAGRIEPVGDIGPEFEATRNFVVTTAGGEWVFVRPGDLLRMDRGEALEQMRKQNIRERRFQ